MKKEGTIPEEAVEEEEDDDVGANANTASGSYDNQSW